MLKASLMYVLSISSQRFFSPLNLVFSIYLASGTPSYELLVLRRQALDSTNSPFDHLLLVESPAVLELNPTIATVD